MDLLIAPTTWPQSILVGSGLILAILAILTVTKVRTTIAYYLAIRRYKQSTSGGVHIVEAPQIPYSIPWLGNTLSFLTDRPGQFWVELFKWHPRTAGVLTLLIGGKKTHIVYSPHAVQALFRMRSANRDEMERVLYAKVFGFSEEQSECAQRSKPIQHTMNMQYMTNFERVNELTSKFTQVLEDVLRKDAASVATMGQIGLYDWLRDRMFTASMTALMGEKLLEMYPNFCEDFFKFDGEFLQFFFGKPDFLMREANERRARIFRTLEKWTHEMTRLSGGKPIDPEHGPAWEPYFGSRLNRARHIFYKEAHLTDRSASCMDAGMAFAIAGNAIPATGWMLFYILNPAFPTLYPRILAEIKQTERPDGSIDVPKLMALPLVQSVWTESLRLSCDVLVARSLSADIDVPLDAEGNTRVAMRKGDYCFAPSWVSMQDPSWGDGETAANDFNPDRFLTINEKTGEQTFSMNNTSSMYFPFGGGKTICPGRTFAKQEAIGGLAMILLRFEFEVKGYVDGNQKPTKDFPGFKNAYPGTAVLAPGGDMVVNIRQRIRD